MGFLMTKLFSKPLFFGLISLSSLVSAQELSIAKEVPKASSQEELAKKLANPIANLYSLPLQLNYDEGMGLNNGSVWKLNIQPVLPFSINDDWNVISRTILPVIDQEGIPTKFDSETGIGDVVQSFFFSPKEPTDNGIVWGLGPVLLLDTASDPQLGGEKWGGGITGVALKQTGPWTMGGLFNHIESFAGDDDRADISATFIQPFLAYVTPTKTTFGINTESTYDWESDQWSIPINASIAQMLKFGDQIVQLSVGPRYWVENPDGAAEDWGFRFQFTFLFPK